MFNLYEMPVHMPFLLPGTLDRIAQEVEMANNERGMFMVQDEDKSPYHYKVYLDGPEDSPYQGYQYIVDVIYPEKYPIQPPFIQIQTKIFHFNINDGKFNFEGGIRNQRLTIHLIMNDLLKLLVNPDPRLCEDEKQFDMFVNDRQGYLELAIEYAIMYAIKINQD